ncbi:MAG TPA: HAMP domain-containing sensor histidine kinase [Gemmatimonadaceae bacterium]|nr:HAMP domain-containing sensor histidine kinase [Gemmatimonadaceae bacterium]
MRGRAPVIILGVLLALLLGAYILFSRRVVLELRRDAGRSGQMYARVFRALADPRPDAGNDALLDLARHIDALGVPVIVTDDKGVPTAAANLPFKAPLSDPRVREYIPVLDRLNPPVVERGIGMVHFGDSQLITSLRFIPVVLASLLVFVFLAGLYTLRTRNRADRERVWAGMARESAHQLATPLSSLSGWLELLREQTADALSASAIAHMEGDLERLQRVSHRFERIGRPPRRDVVDLGALVVRVGNYFQARVPTLAHRVTIVASGGNEPLTIEGDEVLLEWALEVLVKNALDALAGRGGRMYIMTKRLDPDRVRLRVADDGPGIPREMRARIFEPGFSTKESGWGIGLSLAKRIAEENHRGRLILAPSDKGATFDIILQG